MDKLPGLSADADAVADAEVGEIIACENCVSQEP